MKNFNITLSNILDNFFRINKFKYDEKTIDDFIQKFEHLYKNEKQWMNITYKIINQLMPDTILDYEFYFEDNDFLPNEIIFLVCQGLNKYHLKATKRQIHELTYQAHKLYYDWKYCNIGRFNDLPYTVNTLIKLFREDKWEIPEDFLEHVQIYKNEIKLE